MGLISHHYSNASRNLADSCTKQGIDQSKEQLKHDDLLKNIRLVPALSCVIRVSPIKSNERDQMKGCHIRLNTGQMSA